MYRWWIWLKDRRNKIWVTPALGMLVGLLLALGAALLNLKLPAGSVPDIDVGTLKQLLDVVASSMLSVATFSLGVMVSAFASASGNGTPRATELVMGDEGTRTAIGSFLAAFLYAIVARTALGLGIYGPAGRFVLFVATLAVLLYLVVTLVLWVRTLSTLGRVGDTLTRIENATADALAQHAQAPCMGAQPGPAQVPPGQAVLSRQTGYITHLDLAGLQGLAQALGVQLHLRRRPGAFVHPGTVLAVVEGGQLDEAGASALCNGVLIDRARTFEQDPRFGLIVLSEVAQRALSPAVNDPGTAIEAMGVATRLLVNWAHRRQEAEDSAAADADRDSAGPRHPNLSLVPLDAADFLVDMFDPIARDGAGTVEVGVRLQKLLQALAPQLPPPLQPALQALAQRSLARGMAALSLAEDRERLAAAHAGWPVCAASAL